MMEVEAHGYRVIVEQKIVKIPGSDLILSPVNGDQDQPDALQECVVISVGQPKVLLAGGEIPIRVKVGDRIAFTEAEQRITPAWLFGDRNLFIIAVEKITCIMTGDAEMPPPKVVTGRELVKN